MVTTMKATSPISVSTRERHSKTSKASKTITPYIFDEYAHTPGETRAVCAEKLSGVEWVKDTKKVTRANVPLAFDIETTSTQMGNEKIAFMYAWMLGINGTTIMGRTWEDFERTINTVAEFLECSPDRRIVIYVHNLSYEFQFICKRFKWANVFAVDRRTPVYAVTDTGIEFRCSYLLSGLSLQSVGETELRKYKIAKMSGDLDYKKIRHSGTPLTSKEIGYCVHDVLVVMSYIREKIENDGNINKIKLTKTGYVRDDIRKRCFAIGDKSRVKEGKNYRHMIQTVKLTPDQYKRFKKCFAGGFTHANRWNAGKTFHWVASYDITSSYPTVMIAERFPMSRPIPEKVTKLSQLETLCRKRCVMFDIRLKNIRLREDAPDAPISASKCQFGNGNGEYTKKLLDNGRVISADMITTTITNIDYAIFKEFYEWDEIAVANVLSMVKGYLPKPIIEALIYYYKAKTTLKGIDDKALEYAMAKANINSAYGMMVMAIVRDLERYTDHWEDENDERTREALAAFPDLSEAEAMEKYTDEDFEKYKTAQFNEQVEKNNESWNRFLYYPWGVWVTAYARRNVFMAIKECGGDYIYSDTDSVKLTHHERHAAWFERYNKWITRKRRKTCEYYWIDPENVEPKNSKGSRKPLGVFDFEGIYKRFKTLGAKRYIVEAWDDDLGEYVLAVTVAGLNKELFACYLATRPGDPFETFRTHPHGEEFTVPEEWTGKMTHTYFDNEIYGTIVDYTGTPGVYHELSYVHLGGASYSFGGDKVYIEWLLGGREKVQSV